MITPTYEIVPDAAGEFLTLRLAGDWDMPTAMRFAEDVADAIRGMIALGARPGHFLTLIDMRRKNILPQNVADEFIKMVRPDSPSKRIAMLVSGAIHHMQAKRIASERHRIFGCEQDAIAWLREGDRVATAAGVAANGQLP